MSHYAQPESMCLLSEHLGDIDDVGPGDHTLIMTGIGYAQQLATTLNPKLRFTGETCAE